MHSPEKFKAPEVKKEAPAHNPSIRHVQDVRQNLKRVIHDHRHEKRTR